MQADENYILAFLFLFWHHYMLFLNQQNKVVRLHFQTNSHIRLFANLKYEIFHHDQDTLYNRSLLCFLNSFYFLQVFLRQSFSSQ